MIGLPGSLELRRKCLKGIGFVFMLASLDLYISVSAGQLLGCFALGVSWLCSWFSYQTNIFCNEKRSVPPSAAHQNIRELL